MVAERIPLFDKIMGNWVSTYSRMRLDSAIFRNQLKWNQKLDVKYETTRRKHRGECPEYGQKSEQTKLWQVRLHKTKVSAQKNKQSWKGKQPTECKTTFANSTHKRELASIIYKEFVKYWKDN